jgi:2-polyprenyl-3-methyl-5-hydroxy-6-metoxy-1,4-benzoquinol methylase
VSRDRVAAAVASGGASSDRIHEVAFDEIMRDGLGGVALDFGAGRGELASRLAATGAFEQVHAADLVRFADPPAGVNWIEADLNEPLPLPDGSCDLIAAIEVVEHLENVRAVCREWARLLRPAGRVVLTTPNNESLRSLLSLFFRGHFIAFVGSTYPAHITALVRADLERALDEAGLRTERFFYTDEGALPRLTRLTWQRVSGGKLRGVRFSDNLGCVARPDDGCRLRTAQ